jgi:chloramphenicol 3-O phosphotransferase
MHPGTRIVILNGVGSVGKSSIARALQAIADDFYLHVPMDAFVEMLPASSFETPEGLVFQHLDDDGKPSIAIETGPLAARAFRGMRHAVAAMADQGNNMIVDDVMLGGEMAEYAALLARHQLCRVGVFAKLATLEAREQARGDRMIGLARWQYDRVHTGNSYDLEIHTDDLSPDACAQRIKQHFGL